MKIFPQMLKVIENKDYTLKIQIITPNTNNDCDLYKVTDIYERSSITETSNLETNIAEEHFEQSMTEVYNLFLISTLLNDTKCLLISFFNHRHLHQHFT